MTLQSIVSADRRGRVGPACLRNAALVTATLALVATSACASEDSASESGEASSALEPISNLPRTIECDDPNGCPVFHAHDLHAAWSPMPDRVPYRGRLGVYLWHNLRVAVVSYPMAGEPHDVQVVDTTGDGSNSPWKRIASPPSYGALPLNVDVPEYAYCTQRSGCEVFFTDDFGRGAYAPQAVGTMPTRVPCGTRQPIYVKNSLYRVAAISLPMVAASDRDTERYGMVKMIPLVDWSSSRPLNCGRRGGR